MNIQLPEQALFLLRKLNDKGYEGYVVGGYVRDALLGKPSADVDICTNAWPEEIQQVFDGEQIRLTGKRHGTVTVVLGGKAMEVTTYRTDGEYLDARRPKQVAFVRSLKEDLERRDFTMNALAYHPKTGVIDYFGGQTDLKQGVIRCVGKPERRFQEDALRMMRALRFAAVYGFWIEEETRRALIQNWEMTTRLSAERMQMEWNRLLCGKAARKILNEYQALLQPWFWGGKESRRWEEVTEALEKTPPEIGIRLTCLLYGWTPNDAEKRLQELRYPKKLLWRVLTVLQGQGYELKATELSVKSGLYQFGEEAYADILTLGLAFGMQRERHCQIKQIVEKIVREGQCFSLDTLAISGKDLIQEKVVLPGPYVGEILGRLLALVIAGKLDNKKETLLERAKVEIAQNSRR